MPACAYCEKVYQQRALCEDDKPLPSRHELFDMVLHLRDEVQQLNDKISRLNDKISRLTVQQKRTWSLEEALDDARPLLSVREWSKTLVASDEHFEYMTMHGRARTVVRMATEFLEEADPDRPIRAFHQRRGKVYACGEDGEWAELDYDCNHDCKYLLNRFHQMLNIKFTKWESKCEAEITTMEHSEQKTKDKMAAKERFEKERDKFAKKKDEGRAEHIEWSGIKRAFYAALTRGQ